MDIVDRDKPMEEEFLENLARPVKSLQTLLSKFIGYMCNKRYDKL